MKYKTDTEFRLSASGRRKGLLGTVLIHSLVFGMLVIVGFSAPSPPDSGEGILVNFGTGESGVGDIEPSPPADKDESSSPTAEEETSKKFSSPSAVKPMKKVEQLLTQNSEEASQIKNTDSEAVKKNVEKLEAEKKLKEELDAERNRKRAEEAERKKIADELKRESDIMNRTKNALVDSRNRGTSSAGEGIAGGTGNQGDPNGSINSKVRGQGSGLGDSGSGTGNKGISYNLQGRGYQALPPPKYDYQGEGRVVVEVSVDRSGKVVQAIPGTKGSTTLDEYLLKVAKEAALEARFEVKQDAPAVQKGTITYNFILK